jgi:hypothetical protein
MEKQTRRAGARDHQKNPVRAAAGGDQVQRALDRIDQWKKKNRSA